jgi:asparagine synthase (glutamine-hydrolysing)
MCGIFGDIGWNGPPDEAGLRAMDRCLAHRGPDSGTVTINSGIALGSRRLSIVDPAHGAQPFVSDDGSVVVVCNGEIYNHQELRQSLRGRYRFRSNCDVEVLPYLYQERGINFVSELNGQFAIAIHDRSRDVLWLVRDRFGICPLHYHRGKRVRFASDITALLKAGGPSGELDLRGLDQALALPSVVSPRTMFEGVESVRPGHWLKITRDGVSEHEYWDLCYPAEPDLPPEGSVDEHAERISTVLHRAVRRRLQADVPIGLYVSGGLDSAMIAAMASWPAAPGVSHVLSVGFPQAELDETRHQKAVAARLGHPRRHVEVTVDDICRRLEHTVRHSEVPMRESYNVASLMLAEAAHAEGIRVVLSGEGADELFAGYSGYRFDELRSGLAAAPVPQAVLAARDTLWGDPGYGYDLDFAALEAERLALYSPELRASFAEFDFTRFPLVRRDRVRGRHLMHRRSYLDVKLRLADHLLGDHGDRMTMASSVEGRYPFLDPEVVAAAVAIAPGWKLRDFEEKYVLRRAAASWVPRSVVEREKFPFTAPSSPYLVRHAEDFVRDHLSPETLRRQGLFDPQRVRELIDTYASPDYRMSQPLRTDCLMLVLTTTILAGAARRALWQDQDKPGVIRLPSRTSRQARHRPGSPPRARRAPRTP